MRPVLGWSFGSILYFPMYINIKVYSFILTYIVEISEYMSWILSETRSRQAQDRNRLSLRVGTKLLTLPLAETLYPKIHQVLRKLSLIDGAKAHAIAAMRALRGFAAAFKISIGDISVAVDPEPGFADSGILEFDLSELFIRVGEAARSAGMGWTLLIDEVQYLSSSDLSALIVAIHRVNQKQLPIIVFAAGLPQIAALTGDAKSYSERLFKFSPIGPLNAEAAASAIRQPIETEGEAISDEALNLIVSKTSGYPYFLQEWGFQAWNAAAESAINKSDVKIASDAARRRLDEGFFRVRLDRLTPKERAYVMAMSNLGDGPYRSSEIADSLGETVQSLGPRRAKIIKKGMIYSPAHGDIDFTVPMFADYLGRTMSGTNSVA